MPVLGSADSNAISGFLCFGIVSVPSRTRLISVTTATSLSGSLSSAAQIVGEWQFRSAALLASLAIQGQVGQEPGRGEGNFRCGLLARIPSDLNQQLPHCSVAKHKPTSQD